MPNQKENVALSSVFASAAMTVMKLVVGLATGSLGILSEAAHSLLDLAAASLTWAAVRVSDKPADERHPFGHGKIENVSALIETGLLFLTSAWIIREAAIRLMGEKTDVHITWYGIAVILASIVIDVFRARALSRVAKETGSQALEADALHFSSDILSSMVVLLGLGLVACGWQRADSIAAVGVAGFVLLAGYRLGKRTIDVLIDTAPEGVAERVSGLVALMPGVVRIDRVRARPAGAAVFVELVVKVRRGLSLEQVQSVRDAIRGRISAQMRGVDLVVVAEPLTLDDEDITETVRVAAANQGLSVHDISVYTLDGKLSAGFDLEVDEALSLRQAHEIASNLEGWLEKELGGDVGIDIHIDPRRNRVIDGAAIDDGERLRWTAEIGALVRSETFVRGFHRLFLQRGPDGVYVAIHCTFLGEASMKDVHEVTVRLEHDIRARIDGIARVVIHAEPDDRAGDGPVAPSVAG